MEFLNSKQMKELSSTIDDQWGAKLPENCAFWKRRDGHVFVVRREIDGIDLSAINIMALGLYIGELREGELRLSIEGSQLCGPTATKNVVRLSKPQTKAWFLGEEISTAELNIAAEHGFVILKSGKDFIGCGKLMPDKILNFVPKARRITAA